jgi:hypothetical protein
MRFIKPTGGVPISPTPLNGAFKTMGITPTPERKNLTVGMTPTPVEYRAIQISLDK